MTADHELISKVIFYFIFKSAQMELVLFLFDLSGTLITSLISLYLVVLFSYIPALYQKPLWPSGLAIYIKKYLKGKRRMETQIFHHAKI
jgi:hypothetical protein